MPGPPPLIQAAVGGGASLPSSLYTHPTPFYSHPMPPAPREALLHYSFPSEADTLAYVDALKHSDLSDWRSLQEVAARAGAGSCSGAVTTSVLTALYLLGLFNLCVASPASCCVPPPSSRRRRRSVDPTLPPLLTHLQYNLSSLSLEQFSTLPHVTTPEGGRVPLHISVVEQVRKLWDSNPRLLSSVSCSSPTEAVRSSFISLSGVASGIILAYSVAQLNQCYPDHAPSADLPHKIWFFPIPKTARTPLPPPMPSPPPPASQPVPVLPKEIPVLGDDESEDGCGRDEVSLGRDSCAPLLSSHPCPYKHWVLLNRDTYTGECVPRLCADNFVYVESDQMCHHVNDPGLCPGEKRLYLTATGTAVCDCPEGMFSGPGDSCYYLHEEAYCREGSVLQFDRSTKTLACLPDPCRPANSQLWPDDLPYAPNKDGYCYQFNEQKPCKRGQRFGYDTDRLEATCVSLMEAGLSRPRRSFMYQQMSFPASQDQKYHHYQVSYIIMNGTTWDLEVKGVNRAKRDVLSLKAGAPHFLPSGQLSVPFIDTRDIPTDLFPLMRSRRPRRNSHRRTRRGNSHNATITESTSDEVHEGSKHSRSGKRGRSRNESGHPRRSTHRHTRHRKVQAGNATSSAVSIDEVLEGSKEGHTRNEPQHPRRSTRKRTRHGSSQASSATTSADITEEVLEGSKHESQNESKGGREAGQRARRRGRGRKGGGTSGRDLTQTSPLNTTLPHRIRHQNSSAIVKVNQSGAGDPVVVEQTPSTGRSRGSGRQHESRGRKARKKGRGRRKKKGRRRRKKKKGRRRGRKRKQRPETHRNATSTRGKKRRKNPKLPFRVPTVLPPTQSGGVGDVSGGNGTSNQTVQENVIETSEDDDDDEDDQQLSSSSEMSLPKYLRHRDRRQLGDGGGIIQAPLLSACKPGAKRDYNYKCRPRFIPQGRDRRVTLGTVVGPRRPTITCPRGTRLDPRGKCQLVG